jgi:hypothetical protein
MLNYKWDTAELEKAGLSSDDVPKMEEAISNLSEQSLKDTEARRSREAKSLQEIHDSYAPLLLEKIEQAGIDLKSLQTEFKKLSQIEDSETRSKQLKALFEKYNAQFEKAVEMAGINPADVRDSLRALVQSEGGRYGFIENSMFGLAAKPYLTTFSETYGSMKDQKGGK